NASGAKVVTAQTNGACAVIAAVMLYLKTHTIGFSDEKVIEFLFTAMLIGFFFFLQCRGLSKTGDLGGASRRLSVIGSALHGLR
ncbi:L-serine ammonia-lyase, iron-sulfur-dependent, subunit alpha, partial [Bradyrhizobium sp. BRP22]|uniref:L-serine ammonia-lyase, iron-sulfur-dependent, subunit alpha n=1 Tax=Bradyrhizobium sp. BRP22 TaxID=2793821 RepID=UPI001CD728C6